MHFLKMAAAAALATSLPVMGFAAGGDGPVTPTPTTKECKNGKVWSDTKNRCVDPSRSDLSDDTLYLAVRELAHDGQFRNAQAVLSSMSDQTEDRVLTYWGFTHRKLGNVALGMAFYDRALTSNPDNILARSYKGQAHVEAGELVLARAELSEIRRRGGAGTWAETSLARAIQTGTTYNY